MFYPISIIICAFLIYLYLFKNVYYIKEGGEKVKQPNRYKFSLLLVITFFAMSLLPIFNITFVIILYGLILRQYYDRWASETIIPTFLDKLINTRC